MKEAAATDDPRNSFGRHANRAAGALLLLFLGWVFLDPVLFLLGYKEGEIRQLAERIQGQCQTGGGCPATLEGWVLRDNADSVQGHFIYVPGYQGADGVRDREPPYETFLVVSHFGPDWRYEARGGVGRPLQLERIVD